MIDFHIYRTNCVQVALRYADCSDRVQRTLAFMDHEKINYDLIENLIVWILSGKHEYPRQGSILVFLPGLAEISTMYEQLQRNSETSGRSGKCVVVPLHSSLTSEEQRFFYFLSRLSFSHLSLINELV